MAQGKKSTLLYHNNYTFHKHTALRSGGYRYICSNERHGCRVYVHLKDGCILNPNREHNHEPTVYKKLEDGTYLRS